MNNKRDEELEKRGLSDIVKRFRLKLGEAKADLDEAGVEHKAAPVETQVASDATPAPEEEGEKPAPEEDENDDTAYANALAEIMAKHFQEVPENFADIVLASVRELDRAIEPQMVEGGGEPVEDEDTKARRLDLYDQLIDTQAELVTAQDEITTAVKSLSDLVTAKLADLPGAVEELASQVEGMAAEIETVQKALNMRPRLATRSAPVTVGDEAALSELVTKTIAQIRADEKSGKGGKGDNFWGITPAGNDPA